MDTVDKSTRSRIMSRVGQRNTGPEKKLRKSLHRIGLRYRLHDRRLPGSPDIVFPKYRAVLFVHGCFWHRHGCKASTMPKTNENFWRKKFDENIVRDQVNSQTLRGMGWRVGVIWECALKAKTSPVDSIVDKIHVWLVSKNKEVLFEHSSDL